MPPPKKSALLLLSIILFFSFVFFSYLVAKEVFTSIDFDATVKLQNHIPHFLDLPFSLLTIFGSVEATSIVWLVFLVISITKKRYLTAFALGLFWLGLSAEVFGKIVLFHPAPPFYLFRGETIVFPSSYVHTNYSYPSGHIYRITFVIVFIAAYLYLSKITNRTLVTLFFLFGFLGLMVVSRIYLGHHWLSDVIGGLFLGSSLGIIPALTIKNR